MPEVLASTVLSVGKGAYDFFKGRADEKKANEELARLKNPFYKIQDEYTQNRNIAGNMATSGLPDATKDYLTTESQRGLGTSINAITQNGGNPNDAGRLMDIYNSSINRVAAQDAQARIGNIQNFMNVNRELAGQKTIQWSLNEYAPFQRKLKELTQRKAAAQTNQNTGINTAIGAISSNETANQNADLMEKLFVNNQEQGASRVEQGIVEPITSQQYNTTRPVIDPRMITNPNANNTNDNQEVDYLDPRNWRR